MVDLIVKDSEIHGLGVFACREFHSGETILVIDDSRVVDDEHPLSHEAGEYKHHCDYLKDGKVVLMQPPERYINSSCSPNSYVKTIRDERQVIALISIAEGEEITFDYIINCHGGEVWECNCGSQNCRGIIVSSYFDLPLEIQQKYLPLLDDWFREEQEEKISKLEDSADS
jgi:SET domain-containing protein